MARNTSEDVLREVARRKVRGVEDAVLPTEYARAGSGIVRLIGERSPDLVVMLGMGRAAAGLQLERVALNLDDSTSPDNAGEVRRAMPIVPGGPAAYWSTLPLDPLAEALQARGVSAVLSRDAGAFVCNHVFYTARHFVADRQLDVACGFVHLPRGTDQRPRPDVTALADAVEHCIEFVRTHRTPG